MNGILKKEKARFPQKAGSPQKVISHQKAMSSQKTLGKDEGRFLKERGGEGRRRRWAKLWLRIRRNWVLYLFILPAFLYFLIFAYVPMYGIQIAFKDFVATKGFVDSPWADPIWKHFKTFFSSVYFMDVCKNTIGLSLYYILASFPVPIILALMVNEVKNTKFKKLVQNFTYMPYFISTVVLVGMVQLFLAKTGLFNQIGALFGAEPKLFLQKDGLFNDIYVWSGVWQVSGYSAVIYIAALTGVSPELHEAAIMDGATKLQRIRHVNLPAIMPTIVTMLIMSVGGIMNLSFEKVLLMQTDSNLMVSEVISTYVYKLGIQKAQFSLSSAVGLFNNLINVTLLIIVNKISAKISDTSLW